MNTSQDDINLGQFALKPVISLPAQASIAESIRLMYRKQIRHIPVTRGNDVIGVVNPTCIIDLIARDPYDIDFNVNCEEIIRKQYDLVMPEYPLYQAVKRLSQDPNLVILLEDAGLLVGIYTQIDILDADFLWHGITDHPVTSQDSLGTQVAFDSTTSIDHTIHHTVRKMDQLQQQYIALTEHGEMRGIVDFLGIIHHIYYNTYRQGYPLPQVLDHPINVIFPSSGLWYSEPVLLSQIRRELYINDVYYAIVRDGSNQPQRVVTTSDITSYLIEHSDYFET